MGKKKKYFKSTEIAYYNGEYTIREIATKTGRSYQTVRGFIEKYGEEYDLKYKTHIPKKVQVLKLIEEGKNLKEVMEITGLGYPYVKSFFKGAQNRQPNFTKEELRYLVMNYGNISQSKMAKALNRPYQTIRNKIFELRKGGDIVDGTTPETNKPRKIYGGFNVNPPKEVKDEL